ncbi:hypothetical protein PoB_001803600 [Plakobranchus ocellatus]|uniref:Uncharacterized protein n=1 Tax=Plakobranchus ocellatus TaxID=259542 RepID=A0AAV3Z6L4_9GAST|nr:hypothetical protein PoB_001803600 [Plakobranchus ocellatus]
MAGMSGQNGPLDSSTDDQSKKQGTRAANGAGFSILLLRGLLGLIDSSSAASHKPRGPAGARSMRSHK